VFSPPEGARLSNRHFFEFYQISIPNRPEFRHLCQSDTKSSEAAACTDSRLELTSSGLVASEKNKPEGPIKIYRKFSRMKLPTDWENDILSVR